VLVRAAPRPAGAGVVDLRLVPPPLVAHGELQAWPGGHGGGQAPGAPGQAGQAPGQAGEITLRGSRSSPITSTTHTTPGESAYPRARASSGQFVISEQRERHGAGLEEDDAAAGGAGGRQPEAVLVEPARAVQVSDTQRNEREPGSMASSCRGQADGPGSDTGNARDDLAIAGATGSAGQHHRRRCDVSESHWPCPGTHLGPAFELDAVDACLEGA
jgi:hypothetical protein